MRARFTKKIVLVLGLIAISLILYMGQRSFQDQQESFINTSEKVDISASSTPETKIITPKSNAPLLAPISDARARVSKKPFGLKVSPQDSPVSPERFSGYHNAVDFETTEAEQNIEVGVGAICDGKLLVKKWASGYGGVLVQSCQLENNPITVIYGHFKLDSINYKVGAEIKAGDSLGILGKGYSSETDNERKHLHLGIHRGSAISILGYVKNQSDLKNWINILDYLK